MSLIALENIVKEYRNQCVLDGVSLRVERGERVALVGPNGAGKSTLLKIAMGLEACDIGNVTVARNIKVGYLSQDLKDVESFEKNVDSILAMDGYTIETKIKKILIGLGLRQETLGTPLDKLSGGEKMRVSVARILLEEPDLLILDEPTNHLDIKAAEWFEGFLRKFKGGVLFVSHDRYFLDRLATRVAELEKGSLCVRSGNYSKYLEQKNQLRQFISNEQKRLRWSIRNISKTVQGLKGKGKISASKSREKDITKLSSKFKAGLEAARKQEHLYGIGGPKIKFKKIRHVSKDIAWAENLRKSFGDVTLFSGARFHIMGGERIGIIGPNGCGKSTLINMLLGKDNNYEGFLRLGEWVKYSYMGQEVLFENEDITIAQLISLKSGLQDREAREYLARFQFYGDEIDKTIQVLSGGERVRVYLACVMLEDADCLILDEPTNHLDVPARDAVETALKEFRGTIIAVTHDRYFLTHCVGKILEIENGKISTYEGNYDFYKQAKFDIDEEVTEEKNSRLDSGKRKTTNNKKPSSTNKENPEKDRQDIEAQIISLEEKIREMEGFFDEATPMEKYREYGELQKEVENLYTKWNELIQ